MLLAIDPGADTGWALFDSCRRLSACGLNNLPEVRPGHRILIECPRLRPRGEKNPNAILLVARNAGEYGGRYSSFGVVEYLTPNDWKGNLRKSVSATRSKHKLDYKEHGIVEEAFASLPGRNGLAPSKRHNVWDAIGLGLHGVGR
jgi:hypothetical protein